MVQNGSNALKFVKNLHDQIYKQFFEEVETMKNCIHAKKLSIDLKPLNFAYWSEKQRKELYEFDEEEIKPYFNSQKVMEGLFKIFQEI